MSEASFIRKLQSIELDILLDFDAFCTEHHLRYFLGEGTLLGAIRNHGFIPWDDDVDVLMPREDYEQFLKIAPQSMGSKYEVQSPVTIKNCWIPYSKLRLLENSDYQQKHLLKLTPHVGPFIDIFPLDFFPCNQGWKYRIHSLQIRIYRAILARKLHVGEVQTPRQKLYAFLSRFFTVNGLQKRIHRAAAKYRGCPDLPYTVTFFTYQKPKAQVIESSVYREAVRVPFENHLLPVPAGYDLLLKSIYGDYMTPPPPEKRLSKHSFF